MKTMLSMLLALLLIAITVWHLVCLAFGLYVALVSGQPWALAPLVVMILCPPYVLIRQGIRGRWTAGDVVLVGVSVLPGIILGLGEIIMRPNSPNVSWVIPMLLSYGLTLVLVSVMAHLHRHRNRAMQGG